MTETSPDELPGRGDGEHGVALALAEREMAGTASETRTLDVDERPLPDAEAARGAGERWWLTVAVLLAAGPLVRMTRWVLSGTEVPYADYWLMIDEILLPSGGLRVEELFTFSNDHPVAIPKLIYWLNLHNTGGSNIALGLVVVTIVALQLALLAAVLRRSSMPNLVKIAILVVASALLYSQMGAWNFLKAMSGTAWLTANTCAVAALVSRSRGRRWVACAFGVAACLSYGTGLAVWPALLIVGLVSDRRLRSQWPTAVVAVAVGTCYWFGRSTGESHTAVAGPGRLVRFTAEVLSGAIVRSNTDAAVWVGGAVLAAAVVVAVAAVVIGPSRDIAPWLGLTVFGVGGSFLLSLGRAEYLLAFRSNRHFALSALAIIGTIGMLGATFARQPEGESPRTRLRIPLGAWITTLAAAGLAVTGWFVGHSELSAITTRYAVQDRLAIALTFDLASGTREPLGGFASMPAGIEGLLDANDHVPFDGDSFDCGLAGQSIDEDAVVADLPDGVEVRLGAFGEPIERTDVRDGWIRDNADMVRCIVVVSDAGEVIGAGAIGPEREGYGPSRGVPPGTDGFFVVQPIDTADVTYLLVLRDGSFAAIPEPEERIRL